MMLTACTNLEKRKCRLDQASEQLDLIKPHITTGKLYDVGAAAGFVMHVAQSKGWEVYGNELSMQAVAWAKHHYDLDIFHGFLEDDPIAIDNQFDLVVFWNTLEHVRNPIEEMSQATRMLKPNGHIHIEVPIKSSSELIRFSPAGHMTEFEHKSLDILRDKCGLEEVTRWKLKTDQWGRYARALWRKSH
jgi:2-polyprenyl-3-methyl-5-hydroxy-6-metoxy-1,4-benzoquinol methylase